MTCCLIVLVGKCVAWVVIIVLVAFNVLLTVVIVLAVAFTTYLIAFITLAAIPFPFHSHHHCISNCSH